MAVEDAGERAKLVWLAPGSGLEGEVPLSEKVEVREVVELLNDWFEIVNLRLSYSLLAMLSVSSDGRAAEHGRSLGSCEVCSPDKSP